MHEFVLTGGPMKRALGIRTLDLAKRLLDYGFHPPTVYFPLLVDEALLIEPTETETRETLDAFAEAIGEILAEAAEDPEVGAQRALHDAGAAARRGRRGEAAGHPPAALASSIGVAPRAARRARESRIISTTGHEADRDDQQRGQRGGVEARVLRRLPHRDRERVAAERAQQRGRRQLLHHLDEDEQRGGRRCPATAAAGGRRRARGRGRRRGSARRRRAPGRAAPCARRPRSSASAWKRTT